MKLIQDSWNSAFDIVNEKEMKPRSRIWASELGKSDVDIYLKMKGIKPSNMADSRANRKFEAGLIWESFMKFVFLRAGILKDAQKWTSYQYPNLVEVGGYIDFITGGKVDWDMSKKIVESSEFMFLPDRSRQATIKVVENLMAKYPDGLPQMVIEIKSTSGFMFDSYVNSGASDNHVLQIYHYLKSENIESGSIIYICRDSVRVYEEEVYLNSNIEENYKRKIEGITYYHLNDVMPSLEPFIVVNEKTGKLQSNWKVAYSDYLTMLYKYPRTIVIDGKPVKKETFDHAEEYRDYFDPKITQFNSVISRIAKGANMTDKNKEWLFELESLMPKKEIDRLVNLVRSNL